MLKQILIGASLSGFNVAVHVAFIVVALAVMRSRRHWLSGRLFYVKLSIVLSAATLWLLAGLMLAVWTWALAFLALGIFPTIEESLYFSTVAFTTLGFGDVLLPREWQLLSGMSSAVGLMLFGLSTAFLFEAFARVIRSTHRRLW